MADATDRGAETGGPDRPVTAGATRGQWPRGLSGRLLRAREAGIVIVTLLVAAYFAVTVRADPANGVLAFLSVTNFAQMLPYFAPLAILAAGEVFLMINGEIDLSIGGVTVFAPYLFHEIAVAHVPLVPSLLVAVLGCAGIGAINGVLVAVVGINSLIATLGTLFTFGGLTLLISGAEQINVPGARASGNIDAFASVFGGGTYSELLWALGIVIVLQLVLTRMRWGIYTIAVGSNRFGASETGVGVRRILIGNFMLCAMLAGFVGILQGVRATSIAPVSSDGAALVAIAAAVIGGTLPNGGAGTVVGAFIGALFLGMLDDTLSLKGAGFYVGVAILISIVFNALAGRVRRRSGLDTGSGAQPAVSWSRASLVKRLITVIGTDRPPPPRPRRREPPAPPHDPPDHAHPPSRGPIVRDLPHPLSTARQYPSQASTTAHPPADSPTARRGRDGALGSAGSDPGGSAPTGAGSSVPQRGRFGWAAAPIRASRALLTTREGGTTVVTILLCVYFAVTLPPFRTYSSFTVALPFFAPFAILAAGEVFLMINGEIDLSVGGVYVFIPYLFYVIAHAGVPLVPSLMIVLLIAMVVGVANGFLVAVVGVNSFIATLGTLFTLEGLTQLIATSQEVITPGTSVLSLRLSTFASIFGGGTYSELGWALGIVAVMHIILRMTRWGLYTIAVGSNRFWAAEAGVRVRAVLFGNFVICSTLAGLVGILEAVRAGSITPGSDTTAILLSGIAAAAVGGTLLVGGTGSIIGALVGAVFLGVLQDGLVAKGVNANEYSFYLGLAILAAMALNASFGRARRRAGHG